MDDLSHAVIKIAPHGIHRNEFNTPVAEYFRFDLACQKNDAVTTIAELFCNAQSQRDFTT